MEVIEFIGQYPNAPRHWYLQILYNQQIPAIPKTLMKILHKIEPKNSLR